jgi:hypothetical protein
MISDGCTVADRKVVGQRVGEDLLQTADGLQSQTQHDQLAAVDSFHHPDARTIRPRWAGEPVDLNACVHALFTINSPGRRRILISKPP